MCPPGSPPSAVEIAPKIDEFLPPLAALAPTAATLPTAAVAELGTRGRLCSMSAPRVEPRLGSSYAVVFTSSCDRG